MRQKLAVEEEPFIQFPEWGNKKEVLLDGKPLNGYGDVLLQRIIGTLTGDIGWGSGTSNGGEEPTPGGGYRRDDCRTIGIRQSDVGTFEGTIDLSGRSTGIEVSKLGVVKAEIRADRGLDEVDVEHFEGKIEAWRNAIEDSTIGTFEGAIKGAPIYRSQIRHFKGDVTVVPRSGNGLAEGTGIHFSDIELFQGNIVAGRSGISDSNIDAFLGSIDVVDDYSENAILEGCQGITLVGQRMKGPNLVKDERYGDKKSVGNLFIVDEIVHTQKEQGGWKRELKTEGNSILTTKSDDGFPTYKGTIDELQQLLRRNPRALSAVATFGLDGRSEYTLQDLLDLNEHYAKVLWEPRRIHNRREGRWPPSLLHLYNRVFETNFTPTEFAEKGDAKKMEELKSKHQGLRISYGYGKQYDAYVKAWQEYFKVWTPSEETRYRGYDYDGERRLSDLLKQFSTQNAGGGFSGIDTNEERNMRFTELHWQIPGLMRQLPSDSYVPLLVAWDKIFEKNKKEKIKEFFTYLLKAQDTETVTQLIANLSSEADPRMLGSDLVTIGKNRVYAEFAANVDLEHLLSGTAPLPETDTFFAEDSPYRQVLQELLEIRREELANIAYLAQESDIALSIQVEKQLKKWEALRKTKGETREADKAKLMRALDKEIRAKRREFTILAVSNQGKKQLVAYYRSIAGQQANLDALPPAERENTIEAIRAHRKYGVNKGAVALLIQHGNQVYDLPQNQLWLQQSGLDFTVLTQGLGRQTYGITEIGNLSANIERRKAALWEEMLGLLEQYNNLTKGEHTAETVDDIVALGKKLEMPEDSEAVRIYKELFKEKPNEFKGMDGQIKGVPQQVTIYVATPLEAINMGNYFNNSCLAIGKSNGWAAACNAVDIDKHVLYAADKDGKIVGRVLTVVTPDKKLAYFPTYSNTAVNIDAHFVDYITKWADKMGLEVQKGNAGRNIKPLIAQQWYDDSGFF